jgi:hypothetical protein
MGRPIVNHINETNISFYGQKMTIIRYKNAQDIDVEFEDGYTAYHCRYKDFKFSSIKNPTFKNVCRVGCFGIGEYNSKYPNGKTKENYSHWHNMLNRCYNYEKMNKRNIVYEDCFVCEEWLNFQNFAKWYEKNLWTDELDLAVDKDILNKNNKEYNSDNCILVDQRINKLFIKSNKTRGKLPIGVSKQGNRFQASCHFKDSSRYIGTYQTPLEAFQAYKQFKESYIKQVADEYKQKYPNFPDKLYNAMYNYEVEITD